MMETCKKRKGEGIPRSVEDTHHQLVSDSRNPLLNDLVLTRLFELCHISDLPRLRLVCKKWHALAAVPFRRDVPVVFESPWGDSSGQRRWSQIGEELDPANMPFGNFIFKHLEIGQGPRLDDGTRPIPKEVLIIRENIEQFWGKYGSWLRRLELWYSVIHSAEAFNKAIVEETPNLEELTLFEVQDKTGNPPPPGAVGGENIKMQRNLKRLVVNPLCCLPVSWDILSHFPNLQSVEVTPRNFANIFIDNGTTESQLSAISDQVSKRQPPCRVLVMEYNFWLREQPHFTPVTHSFFKRLLQIPKVLFPKLDFYFSNKFNDGDGGEYDVDLLTTASRHQGQTLEELIIYSVRDLPYDTFPFQHGPFNLTTSIELTGKLCDNLHFLQNFPNLKILQMSYFHKKLFTGTESTTMETFTLKALNELRFDAGNYYIPEDKMEMLVKVMPNVEKFHGKLGTSSLRVLCREWRQLKVLILESVYFHEDMISDEGITGIVFGRGERLPNITDLQELETLYASQVIGLGDASIWYGFLQMPKLKQLDANISGQASASAFGALTNKFPGGGVTRANPVVDSSCS